SLNGLHLKGRTHGARDEFGSLVKIFYNDIFHVGVTVAYDDHLGSRVKGSLYGGVDIECKAFSAYEKIHLASRYGHSAYNDFHALYIGGDKYLSELCHNNLRILF